MIRPSTPARTTPWRAPLQPSVQPVQLTEYGLRLVPGVPYRWSGAPVVDPESKSRDILASGIIERVAPPEALWAQLAGAGQGPNA